MAYADQLAQFRDQCGVPVAIKRSEVTSQTPNVPYVATDLSPGEIIQAYNESFDQEILSLYGVSTYNLQSLMRFGSFYRVIVMLAEALAGIMTSRGLCVVDREGNKITNARALRALHIVTKRPAPGVEAPIFWGDMAAEMLVTGNSLLHGLYEDSLRTRVSGFELASTVNSQCDAVSRTNIPLMYKLGFIGQPSAETAPAHEVAHARFPVLSQKGSNKPGFAPSPVIAVVAATEAGRELDKRLKRWASDNRGNMHINLKAPPGMTQIKGAEDVTNKLKPILKSLNSRQPLLTENADIKVLEDRVMEKNTVELKEHQTEDILRVYGVPAPVGGVQLTAWGSGIDALTRLYYNSALRPNLERILPGIETMLLPAGQRFLPDLTDVIRGDAASIQTMIQALSGNQNGPPYATVDEIRHLASMANGTPELQAERDQWHERNGSGGSGQSTNGGGAQPPPPPSSQE